ncbi:MAG TPA: PsbP-related protein [Bacteroidota bacterium]|nr:PsbP-related protein [Bacteroidota bacterium]
MKRTIAFFFVTLLALAGCGTPKIETIQVGEMNQYTDPGYGFSVQYPKDWKNYGNTGKAVFAKSQEVLDKFLDPRTGVEGEQVAVDVLPYAGKTADVLIQGIKDDLKNQNAEIKPDQPMTVGGKQAVAIAYRIQATTKTSIFGQMVLVQGDTALYKLDFEGYGPQFDAHVNVNAAILKSFVPPVVVAKKPDVWNPSQNMADFDTKYFTIKYPDNMEFVEVNKGNNEFAMERRADRRDCSIHIDVFGAKNLTVDKVWDQNKGKYSKAKNNGTSTIDGAKAYWVDYSPMANINSRAYFIVKNDKVIRVTLNWFAPQKDIYFTVFEKSINSLKLK